MSKPAGGKKGATAKAAAAEAQEELRVKERLQAIVTADTFTPRLSPLTLRAAAALIPVAGAPALEYTLELLSSSGVQDIFVATHHHAHQISEYIASSPKWKKVVTVVEATEAGSSGDLVREVFRRNLINTSDFFIVEGDVVSNVSLAAALEQHRRRREHDKGCVMTMLMARAPPRHPARSREDDAVVALDSATGQLLRYECDASEPRIALEDVFELHSSVSVRYDLADSGIAVCGPEVLMQLESEFDYRNIAPDFVKGTLDHSDLLNYKIHVQVVANAYAARARDLGTYAAVSRDIMRRWVYPAVPENNISGATAFAISRGLVYKDAGAHTARGAVLDREVVLGAGTTVAAGAFVSQSVVGARCKIGANARVVGCILGDNVSVGECAVIEHSIMGNSSAALERAVVAKGCVVGPMAVIGRGYALPAFSKLVGPQEEEGDYADDLGSVVATDLGDGGCGALWVDADAVPRTNSLVPREDAEQPREGDEQPAQPESESESESEESSDDDGSDDDDDDDDVAGSDDEPEEDERFDAEVADLVDEAVAGACPQNEFELQVNSLRFTYNMTARDCAKSVIKRLVVVGAQGKATKNEVVTAVRAALKKHIALTRRYISAESPCNDQTDLLLSLQSLCCGKNTQQQLREAFPFIMHALYDCDVIGEDAIFGWEAIQKAPATARPESAEFLALSEKLLEWLRTADEDDNEDE